MNSASPTLVERPPVVAVLGHVDHGKSTLLDFIRKTNIVAGEAGGITQHVAAYEVVHPVKADVRGTGKSKRITFIDTPGHAAFKTIRERGANVADIAILVVAADDGVKAQTLEALKSIRDAKTPFVVAINKIDKPNADLSRTQRMLLEQNVFLEQLGGDVPWAAISAKTGAGIDELLDLILLVAEVQELKGDTSVPAEGFCVEANRDKKRGIAATLIIKNGTLESGQFVRAGRGIAPVRIMEDHTGQALKRATFSTPVSLIGFDELPDAGSVFHTHDSKRKAEDARNADASLKKAAVQISSEENPDLYLMPVIIRADTTGSLDAIEMETAKLGDEHRRVRIVQSGIGTISEDDIKSAIAAGTPPVGGPANVFGFNTGIERVAEAFARERGVAVETFDIIYKLTERLEELLKKSAPKRAIETVVGRAKVLKYFSSRHDEHVIGAKVLDGELRKKGSVRIVRRDAILGKGKILNLQANKQNVEKVETEGEFGAQIVSEIQPSPGDVLECIESSTE
ncbi:GTP-binding protein [Candidatus Kaiserbacteria bacterium]|nr:GTP-binding protein [Candidatus Kaiserbacteria bacterium]